MPLRGQYEYVIDKTHPRASPEGMVYTHMLVAEKILGRFLLPEEVVHHKDLNKLNNDPNNIMVFATNSDHARFHANNCDESILTLNSNGIYSCQEKKYFCVDCGAEITKYGTRCSNCAKIYSRKVMRPTFEELSNLLYESKGNFTKIGNKYGVSDNAVRKWCRSYNIPSKSRDYKKQAI